MVQYFGMSFEYRPAGHFGTEKVLRRLLDAFTCMVMMEVMVLHTGTVANICSGPL